MEVDHAHRRGDDLASVCHSVVLDFYTGVVLKGRIFLNLHRDNGVSFHRGRYDQQPSPPVTYRIESDTNPFFMLLTA